MFYFKPFYEMFSSITTRRILDMEHTAKIDGNGLSGLDFFLYIHLLFKYL